MTCPGCGVTLTEGLPCACSSYNVISLPFNSINRILNGESQYMRILEFNDPTYQLIANNIENVYRNGYLIENNREFPPLPAPLPIDVKFRITEDAYKKILEYKTTTECKKECKGGECVICTETYSKEDSVIMPCCQNEMHKKCCKEWVFNSSPTCPLCRYEFEKEIQENTL
tara:strand:- start:9990 stop:10502 length:513 start_codon:yes stop_codon:yes gene_type:complete